MNGIKLWKKTMAVLLCTAIALSFLPLRTQAVQALYSAQTLVYNGSPVPLDAYNIEGYTYFRLRDLAALLSGSIFRFSLEIDEQAQHVNAVRFQENSDILTASGEDFSRSCTQSAWRLMVDGTATDCAVYNIGGHNFYRLRDLAAAIGFAVGYNADTAQVLVYAEPLSDDMTLEDSCFQALALLHTAGEPEAGIAALTQAAQDGCARAAYELAEGYYYGSFGLPQSYARSAACAKAAADGKNPRGQYLYGLLLWSGQGVRQDAQEALRQFTLAAQAGNIQAQSFLGAYLYEESPQQHDGLLQAAVLSKTAADFGDGRAAYTYGRCLYHGRGTTRNYVMAAQYFASAAQAGIADAAHALGVCYYEGAGVRFNPYIALYYFELAAGMGCAPAAYNAGICYAQGVGTEIDLIKAVDYMQAAAKAGISQAEDWLAANKVPEVEVSSGNPPAAARNSH